MVRIPLGEMVCGLSRVSRKVDLSVGFRNPGRARLVIALVCRAVGNTKPIGNYIFVYIRLVRRRSQRKYGGDEEINIGLA
jgi:hypothetical protein